MKAAEITDRLIAELTTGQYRHARLNFANGDMVGHTGHLDASVMAVEAVDLQIARILRVIERLGGALIVTADHGNADCMFDVDPETGEPKRDADGRIAVKTSHTLNRVPLHVFAPGRSLRIDPGVRAPGLANVAATVLHLLGLQAPDDYAPSLLAAD
jgi:2,3-bisphosphoglycerate-independent phosphoglycerate mutase